MGVSLRYAIRFERGEDAGLAVEVEVEPEWPGGAWVLALPPLEPIGLQVEPGGAARVIDRSGRVEVPKGARRLAWRYPLARARELAGGDFLRGAGDDGAWCVSGAAYLLRPEVVRAGARVALRFEGPVGAPGADPGDPDLGGALLPWSGEAPGARAVLDPGIHVFGATRRRDGEAVVALLPGSRRASDDEVVAWLAQARAEVALVRDGFPQARLVVAVVPVAGVAEASPFGMVQWSVPTSMAIYLGGEADAAALARDWVAVHEHMHLVHPRFVGDGLDWLAEGVATYLSVVARARSGRLSPELAWGELTDGVLDGRRRSGGRGLGELTADMHRLHAYRSVYWGGTLVALELDVALREATGGRAGLDEVVAALREAGGDVGLDGLERAVDAAAGRPIAGALLRAHLEGPALSRARALLDDLGLALEAPAPGPPRASLGPGPRAAVRDAIGRSRAGARGG